VARRRGTETSREGQAATKERELLEEMGVKGEITSKWIEFPKREATVMRAWLPRTMTSSASHAGIRELTIHHGKCLQDNACGSKLYIYLLYAITFIIQLFSYQRNVQSLDFSWRQLRERRTLRRSPVTPMAVTSPPAPAPWMMRGLEPYLLV
jgi:hypothetical protein